jgi:hypothetical protein
LVSPLSWAPRIGLTRVTARRAAAEKARTRMRESESEGRTTQRMVMRRNDASKCWCALRLSSWCGVLHAVENCGGTT